MPPNSDASDFPVAVEAPATVVSFHDGRPAALHRLVPAEVPVNIVYAGMPFAVMMATPADLHDFAVGFSLTEGVIRQAGDVRSFRTESDERGIRLLMDLAPDRLHAYLARKRALVGRTGCGLCGIDDLDSLPRARSVAGAPPIIAIEAVRRALDALETRQPLNEATRAVHAAGWSDLAGDLLAVREDVGRHNALDKLIGALCREGVAPEEGFFIVTSRCSFELVEKVAAFGARTLVAISAPTSLALERARLLDITLAAIARRDTMTVFHGSERIRMQEVSA